MENFFLIGISRRLVCADILKLILDGSTMLSKYFKRKINQISVLFSFLQRHMHTQLSLFVLHDDLFSFSFILHLTDIHPLHS